MGTKIFVGDENNQAKEIGNIQNFVFDTMLPSNNFSTPITVGASGMTYTTPDNGYVCISANTTVANGWFVLKNISNPAMPALSITSPNIGATPEQMLPVLKGTVISLTYNGISIIKLNFIPSAKAISEQYDMDVDYVVKTFRSSDGSSWYRKYKSGLVEQGGWIIAPVSTQVNVSTPLLIPLNIAALIPWCSRTLRVGIANQGLDQTYYGVKGVTENSIIMNHASTAFVVGSWWEVKGQAA